MKKILFQGDSITDAGRARNNDDLGRGYANLAAAKLGYTNPNEYAFYNRGISGNRIVDLYARIKCDMINIAPDYMSILIGVNDVWHEYPGKNGVDAAKFEKIYSMLIEEFKEACPNTDILIMEPFVLPGVGTDKELEDGSALYPVFRSEVEKRAAAAKRIADRYHLRFLPLQATFDELGAKISNDYWLADGVHPTLYGHEMMANAWLHAFDLI